MRHEKTFWCVAVVAACVLSATAVYAYNYNVGPNYVNMSGSRCRAETSALGDPLTHADGSVMVNAGTSTRRLYCPIQRRGASYYAQDVSNAQKKVNVPLLSIWAQDNSTSGRVSCFGFASGIGNAPTLFSPTRFLCDTAGGCTTVANSWQGMNGITLSNPFPSVNSYNWGIACDVPGGSKLLYSQSRVLANE